MKKITIILLAIITINLSSCSKEKQAEINIKGKWSATSIISYTGQENWIPSANNPRNYTNPEKFEYFYIFENINNGEGDLTIKQSKIMSQYGATPGTYINTVEEGYDLTKYTFKIFNEGESITIFLNNYAEDEIVYSISSLTNNKLTLNFVSETHSSSLVNGLGEVLEFEK